MALRFQLINETVGNVILDQADPIDINALTRTIKRSEEHEGIVYEIVFDVEFIKLGRRFLQQCYETAGGIDAVVLVNIYRRDVNARRWKLYATGQVNFNRFEITEDKIIVNIEQTGVERRVLNLMETDLDIEAISSISGTALPDQEINNIEFHSKAVLKEYEAFPSNGIEYEQPDVFSFHLNNTGANNIRRDGMAIASLDFQNESVMELEEIFTPNYTIVDYAALGNGELTGNLTDYVDKLTADKNGRFEFYRAAEAGIIDIDIRLTIKPSAFSRNDGGDADVCGSGSLGKLEVNAWLEKRNSNDDVVYVQRIGTQWDTPGCGTDERIGSFETKEVTKDNESVDIGDKYYVYMTYRIFSGDYQEPGLLDSEADIWHTFAVQADEENTWIRMVNKTSFTPSEVQTVFLYDAIERCVQYYTSQTDCFKSNLLGRTERGYAEDGEGALIAITNGFWLRRMNEKSLFANLKDLIEFANSVFCVGFGFETVDGKQIFRLERREFFYDKTTTVISLGKVYDIKRRLANKKFYNQIEVGYSGKIDIGQVNAIDEFNTIRRYSIPILNTKNTLKVATTMRVSGYQIEAQRRFASSTKDSNLDDENFAVVLVRDGGTYKPKTNEGYAQILNVLDSETGYNYDISPGRIVKNWLKVIASSLIRSSNKIVKFAFGEVNYSMATRKFTETALTYENGDIDVSLIEPIVDNEIFEFSSPLTAEEMELIVANPYGVIEFEDRFGVKMEGFIADEGIEHDESNNKADFKLIRVYRNSN